MQVKRFFAADMRQAMKLVRDELGADAAIIGTVTRGEPRGMVSMRTSIGGERLVDMPFGELLPRIC